MSPAPDLPAATHEVSPRILDNLITGIGAR
jgi:hypothetical protein